ncbi:hypothetical protein ABZ477_18210 [Microbacterium sp. NPDC019599]|uniref:hypothetical protein n=1 Tax=Microbacterium sp. NPDC019599 TaxID=3154690 RepID=UPI0033E9D519
MSSSEIDDLRAQVERLQAENATLRTAPVEPAAAPPRRSRGTWRAFVSALVIVIASILVPVSIVAAWARVQLVDEEAFVATLAPLAQDPAVQQLIIDEAMDAVNANVDFDELTSSVFDGIAQLGLPPRAQDALQLLQAPAAAGLENLVTTAVTRVVESDAFANVWATTTRAAHRALTTAATSDGGGLVVMTDDGVGIQLGAIVAQVKQNLIDRGIGVAQVIPAVDKVVIIGTGSALVTIRTTYAIASTLGFWLPIITLALFGLGILIARRRSVAVIGTGIGFAVGGGALALGFAVGYPLIGQVGAQLDLSVAGLDVIYGGLIASMHQTAAIIALLGVFIAVLGWFMGRSAPAERSRGFVRSMNSAVRRRLASRGLNTGGFGLALARYKIAIRVVIAVVAVLWLYALRPLSVGDVFLVIIVSFAVAWLLELLQRRPEELEALDAEESAAEQAAADAEVAAADAEVAAARAEAAAVWADPGAGDAEIVGADAGTAAGDSQAALVGASVDASAAGGNADAPGGNGLAPAADADAPAETSEEAPAEAPAKKPRTPRR